jgi:putative addiction module component (TIGR02574 family)
MIEANEELAAAALALPPAARAELAERLLRSLDAPQQVEIDAAWADEAERRITQLDRGEVKLLPGETVMNLPR